MTMRATILAGFAALALLASPALAQQPGSGQFQPTQAGVNGCGPNGHVCFTGSAPPTLVGGTADDGSTDNEGSFVASAGSGSITFAFPFARPPFCDVTGYTGSAPASYTVSALAITLSTITSTDRYTWQCVAKPGG